MTVHALPSARVAADELIAILGGLGFVLFDSDVDDKLVVTNPDGRLKQGYAVLYAGAGNPLVQRWCRTPDSKQFPFQVTAVGGDRQQCIWVADKVNDAIVGRRLSNSTPITTGGFEPGPIQPDRSYTPSRMYTPLQYTCRLA